MRTLIALFLCIIAVQFPNAQKLIDADYQRIQTDVVYLASDYLEGRETGKPGEMMAGQYIAHRMDELGLEPKGTDDSFFQAFEFEFKQNPHAETGEKRTGRNVIGYLNNNASTTIVIGAHYDHIGMGSFGSRYTGEPAIHNGADDNASGVAALLRLAEELQTAPKYKKHNYLFIAFSGEEMGLYGSKHFVKMPTIRWEEVNCMLNMDMVGRLNEERTLVVSGVGTSPSFEDALNASVVHELSLKMSPSGVGPSDHTSFYLKDIPVLHFFTGQHQDYHKPIDDAHLLNFEGIYQVTDFIVELIEELGDQGRLEFTKTQDSTDSRKAAKFKVTLGVMPDYVYAEEGMRIDAVIDDRPAANAGLRDGDVVVKIGEMKIKDIYAYMEALSNYQAGDKAPVTVKRGKFLVTVDVQF